MEGLSFLKHDLEVLKLFSPRAALHLQSCSDTTFSTLGKDVHAQTTLSRSGDS